MTTGGITDGLLPVSKLGDASVVVYIGTQPSDIAQNPESTPHVHVQTFQEVSSISVRKKIAQMMDSTLHNAADDAQFPNTGQPQSIVTAVLRLDNKHHASIDSVLGEVIRLFPDQVLVNCRDNTLGDERFFAFGFTRYYPDAANRSQDLESCWYEYRMRDYKSPPDWLNARFWANPERFNLTDDPDLYCEEEE